MAICLLNDMRVLINFNRKPRCLEGVQWIPVEFQHCARLCNDYNLRQTISSDCCFENLWWTRQSYISRPIVSFHFLSLITNRNQVDYTYRVYRKNISFYLLYWSEWILPKRRAKRVREWPLKPDCLVLNSSFTIYWLWNLGGLFSLSEPQITYIWNEDNRTNLTELIGLDELKLTKLSGNLALVTIWVF